MNTETKWKLVESTNKKGSYAIDSIEPRMIHIVDCIQFYDDGKLIAAAPELLRALRVAQHILSNVEYNLEYKVEHDIMINDAINKVIK